MVKEVELHMSKSPSGPLCEAKGAHLCALQHVQAGWQAALEAVADGERNVPEGAQDLRLDGALHVVALQVAQQRRHHWLHVGRDLPPPPKQAVRNVLVPLLRCKRLPPTMVGSTHAAHVGDYI